MHSSVLDEDETLRRIVDTIVETLDPKQVILFGSRARGDDTAESDYDLCVIADSEQPYHDRNVQVHRLFPRRDFSMDAFVLPPEEYDAQRQVVNTLGFYVDQDGEVLYERVRNERAGVLGAELAPESKRRCPGDVSRNER